MSDIKSKNIELVDIDSIVPNPKNANRHSIEQIKRLEKLIKYQGFRNPLIVSNRTGFLVVGHGRLEAAKNLGIEKLPVIKQDFESEAQEYAYLISDNEIARWAELDKQSVYEELKTLELDDIELLGLEDFEIPDIEELDPQTDEDEVPEVEHPITKRGDIWLLGKHRLMCGDSTMIDDVEKLMNGETIDAVYTDPPYGIDEQTDREFFAPSRKAKGNSFEKIIGDKSTDTAVSFCNYYLGLGLKKYVIWGAINFCHSLPETGQWLIWDKREEEKERDMNSDCELAWVQTGKKTTRIFRHKWKGMIKASEHGQARVHPTQKPVALAEFCFGEYDYSGNVLDGFLGSGSTLIACENRNLNCYGFELSEKYCDVIINRWQNYTGKQATLESTGQTYEELKTERL